MGQLRPVSETILKRAKEDPEFRAALLAAGLQTARGRRLEHERNAALRILRSPVENYDEIDSQEVAL